MGLGSNSNMLGNIYVSFQPLFPQLAIGRELNSVPLLITSSFSDQNLEYHSQNMSRRLVLFLFTNFLSEAATSIVVLPFIICRFIQNAFLVILFQIFLS